MSWLFRPRAETASDALIRAMRGGGGVTKSGARVTEDSALSVADVYKCVRVIAEDIAKLPLILYRRLPNGGKERATDHPLYALMDEQPNGLQTAFEFREMMQGHIELRGNAYARKVRVRGQVRELLPMNPAKVSVRRRSDWENVYTFDGDRTEYGRADVLHLTGLSSDGLRGLSPVTLHRETFGFSLAAAEYGAKLLGNSARPGGVLQVDKALTDKSFERIKESWEQAHGGENMHRTAILEEGVKWTQVGMSSEDAQYLETRQFERSEIAGLFRVPPHKIGDLTRSTNNNIEHQSQEYIDDALMPRLRRWEQRLNLDLLTPAERRVYFFEFLPEALLKGDVKSRFAAYQSAINTGWMSPNEVRVRENLNPADGLDEFRRPLNMETVGDTALDDPKEKE